MLTLTIALSLLGYLVGSIASAVIICRLIGLGDPRQHGSGNPGATNVLRLAGKKTGAAVLCCDMLKGALPVLVGHYFMLSLPNLSLVVVATMLGHLYPVFFQFKGGKGVATAAGGIIALSPMLGLLLLFTWIGCALIWRYSSLASIVTALLAPVYATWLLPAYTHPALLLVSLLIFSRHYDNIKRLRSGTEHKIKLSAKIS